MKIELKDYYKVRPVFIAVLCFIMMGFLFRAASTPINFAPLFLLSIVFLYAKIFKKVEKLPSYLDLLLLLSIIVVTFFFITFIPERVGNLSSANVNIVKVSVFGIATIGFAMIVALLFDNLELSLLFSIFLSQLGLAEIGRAHV